MSIAELQNYLAVGAIMFVIGLIGFMSRRNLIVIFLCTELMFQGVAINLIAPFYLMQAAIPHLLQTQGAVVNVTSTAAFVGEAYAAAYCATKAGLTQMTKALAMEYVHKSIRFNAVAPGGMATNIGNTIKMPEGVDYALIKRYSGLRGLVEVDDVADIIAFLASDAARGYHGACINIDRGISAG